MSRRVGPVMAGLPDDSILSTHKQELQSMVIEVKGGKHVTLNQVMALRGS
ncbi:MAG: hypothetical protein OXF97_00740 [Nitrospira sp.]|nr:hypothetical protein [Nitrospira sp.]MCY3954928.1 hypothetical protein [Nitrospira sp.]MCY4132270.1 hypothetical protein [Nitrospira sp.]